jgi:hypothetical protein
VSRDQRDSQFGGICLFNDSDLHNDSVPPKLGGVKWDCGVMQPAIGVMYGSVVKVVEG